MTERQTEELDGNATVDLQDAVKRGDVELIYQHGGREQDFRFRDIVKAVHAHYTKGVRELAFGAFSVLLLLVFLAVNIQGKSIYGHLALFELLLVGIMFCGGMMYYADKGSIKGVLGEKGKGTSYRLKDDVYEWDPNDGEAQAIIVRDLASITSHVVNKAKKDTILPYAVLMSSPLGGLLLIWTTPGLPVAIELTGSFFMIDCMILCALALKRMARVRDMADGLDTLFEPKETALELDAANAVLKWQTPEGEPITGYDALCEYCFKTSETEHENLTGNAEVNA